jgi:hypothetical protein
MKAIDKALEMIQVFVANKGVGGWHDAFNYCPSFLFWLQQWGDAFLDQSRDLPLFVLSYHDLLSKGYNRFHYAFVFSSFHVLHRL